MFNALLCLKTGILVRKFAVAFFGTNIVPCSVSAFTLIARNSLEHCGSVVFWKSYSFNNVSIWYVQTRCSHNLSKSKHWRGKGFEVLYHHANTPCILDPLYPHFCIVNWSLLVVLTSIHNQYFEQKLHNFSFVQL